MGVTHDGQAAADRGAAASGVAGGRVPGRSYHDSRVLARAAPAAGGSVCAAGSSSRRSASRFFRGGGGTRSWWRSVRSGNLNSAITNSGIWRGSARYSWMPRPSAGGVYPHAAKPGRQERARRCIGADAGHNPAATLRMGPAQCGGEAAKVHAHCGGRTHIQPERCFCERIRNSIRARVKVPPKSPPARRHRSRSWRRRSRLP